MKQNDAEWSKKRQVLTVGLRNRTARMEVVAAIRKMGSAAAEFLPALIKALDDSTTKDRSRLTSSPSAINLSASENESVGLAILEEAEFRRMAIIAIGEIGSGTEKAVRVLIRALEDPDAMVRTAAIGALARMGLAANVALSALLRLLSDPRDFVREIATRSLTKIDPQDPRIVSPLIEALKDPSSGVRLGAAEALGNTRPSTETALSLAGALQDTSPGVRIAVAKSLEKFGASAKPAVPALTKAMDTIYDSVRKAASSALDRIGV